MSWSAYPDYKDSGVEWLGKIPAGWSGCRLKYLTFAIPGGTPDTENSAYWSDSDDGIPWVSIGDMSQRDNVFATKKSVSIAGLKSKGLHVGRPGTILFAMYASVGEVSVLRLPAAWNQALLGFEVDERVCSNRFLFYSLVTVRDRLPSLYRSNTQNNLNADQVENLALALPGLTEQDLIADFLDEETTKIDALISKQNHLIATLREDRTATITHAVTRGLNPDAEMKESGIEWLGEVPATWHTGALKRWIAKIESGTSVNAADEPATSSEIGVLKTSCVYSGVFDISKNKTVVLDELNRVTCPVKQGTLIVSRMNTPDLVGAAGYVGQSRPGIFLPDRLWQISFRGLHPKWVSYWSKTRTYRDQLKSMSVGTSSSMHNISQPDYGSLAVAVPPEKDQECIAAFLDAATAKVDTLIAKASDVVETLREYRSALITAAVTGKIDVRKAA